ncbi:MAG: SEC-C domain-containing protein [Gemmatimonadetes bacterium]|nr:SEC-C domain-containing protein [Gemmatimonadota bacterium]
MKQGLPWSTAGRTDPGPCGSGKKFKKCCGREAAPPAVLAVSETRRRAGLLNELVRFAARPAYESELRRAFVEYWGDDFQGLTLEEAHIEIEGEPGGFPFWDWLLHDFRLADGRTFIDTYLTKRGVADVEGRVLLEKASRSVVSLYRVEEVRPDEGFMLRDLVRGGTVEVQERAATRSLVRWDLIAARVIELDGALTITSLLPFRASEKEDLSRALAREYRRYLRACPGASREDFLKERAHWFHHYSRALEQKPLPQLVTAEGDPLLFCRGHYRMTDAVAVASALRAVPDLRADDEDSGQFDWLEGSAVSDGTLDLFGEGAGPVEATAASVRPPFPAVARPGEVTEAPEMLALDSARVMGAHGEGRRGLGHIELRDDRLTLECMSRERLVRGRALLEHHAGAG